MWILKIRKKFKNYLNDSLLKNSYYLIANTLLTSGSGFFFLIFATRLYSPEDVGLGSALMSASWLIYILSLFGFDTGLIRFIPLEKNNIQRVNSCFTISLLAALVFAVIFILGLHMWSPALIILRENMIYGAAFVLFSISGTLFGLQTNIFVGFRQTKYTSLQAVVSTLRILILPLLVSFGAFGVYSSVSLATALSFLVGNILVSRVILNYKLFPAFNVKIVKEMFHYSLGNYLANMFYYLPIAILPLIVINFLGRENNAYYSIAWGISSMLLMIPFSTSTSLFAEGSFSPGDLRKNVIKSIKFIFIILIPAIIGIFIFGKYVLLLFGKDYAKNALEVLQILSIASIPYAVNMVYIAYKRVKQEILPVICVYGGIMVLTLIGSYISIQSMGLIGVGLSWVLGNGIVAGVVGVKMIIDRK